MLQIETMTTENCICRFNFVWISHISLSTFNADQMSQVGLGWGTGEYFKVLKRISTFLFWI